MSDKKTVIGYGYDMILPWNIAQKTSYTFRTDIIFRLYEFDPETLIFSDFKCQIQFFSLNHRKVVKTVTSPLTTALLTLILKS